MIFREWNFHTRIVTEWAPLGTCDACQGECLCCKGSVEWQVAMPTPDMLAQAKEIGGGLVVDGEGIWQEFDTGKNRVFRKYIQYNRTDHVCPLLEGTQCTQYENRPMYCRSFPLSPTETKEIPECSYRWAKIKEESF